MRTNIDIDDDVLREAQRLVGTRTKSDTVNLALRELVTRHRRIGVLDLPVRAPNKAKGVPTDRSARATSSKRKALSTH